MRRASVPVPPQLLERLRSLRLALPDAVEESAWTGTRWCVRGKNFSHVLMVDRGWPPAFARAAKTDCTVCVLTVRSGLAEMDPDIFSEAPFFRPRWFADIVGLILDDGVDWDEVHSLILHSYCRLAPRRLRERILKE